MKRYGELVESAAEKEFMDLMEEAGSDPAKMEVFLAILEENGFVSTASAPGVAMVSDGEPVLVKQGNVDRPKMTNKPFGKGIWRRKKRKPDISEMALPKKKVAHTGHLEHVADTLFHGDPHEAIRHMEAMHSRFRDKPVKGHQASLKVDGGMSVIVGRDHDGKHFVRSKHGDSTMFKEPEQIHATGKPHYSRDLVPLLHHVRKMDIKPGTAFQADLVHHGGSDADVVQPNTIKYKVKKGKSLVLATHSQYEIPKQ
jgi:hypothetical protein